MRFSERFRKLKEWAQTELCDGRVMKAPAPNMDISEIVTQEPKCYIAWAPSRLDRNGNVMESPMNVVPGIIIMPNHTYAKYTEEKRFDRYNNIHRSQEMGQHLNVSMLFSVYEPGIRLPGFVESVREGGKGLDMDLFMEGTEQGFMTLINWIDDALSKLLGQKFIPHTDMFLEEAQTTYSLYTDQQYVVDRRPIYYGFINAVFTCHANEEYNEAIEGLL
jgi:hypothetical protein